MKIRSKWEVAILFLGDLICFAAALWLALIVRYRNLPDQDFFWRHFVPFSFIFVIWILVFFIADLYRKPTGLSKRKLPSTIFNTQIANTIIAVLFFYLIPYFDITPKTLLFLDLAFTLVFIIFWRRLMAPRVWRGRREKIYFACQGKEVEEIKAEIASNKHYNLEITTGEAPIVVINPHDEGTDRQVSDLYRRLFEGVRFVNVYTLYEEMFDRIPVSLLNEYWFLENISNHPKILYSIFKRLMDIVLAGILGLVSLVVYPVVWLAIKFDDGGPVFYRHERVGQNNRVFTVIKFRSMSTTEKEKITRVGKFLRRTRIDELPQLWGVVAGGQSLVGPRPEMPHYAEKYRQEIPYYDARHLVTPGLSGWAQIYHENEPKFAVQTDAMEEKLSYDLFYVKNRSLWLDITIALKTIKELASREGK